jgi:flagellar hook-basal body complex protein FliE
MNEMDIRNVTSLPLEKMGGTKSVRPDPLSDFKEALTQSIRDVNQKLVQGDQSAQEMMLGKKDVHQAMMDLEQANLSLRLLIQIRNKIISAYEEIMRMQF